MENIYLYLYSTPPGDLYEMKQGVVKGVKTYSGSSVRCLIRDPGFKNPHPLYLIG